MTLLYSSYEAEQESELTELLAKEDNELVIVANYLAQLTETELLDMGGLVLGSSEAERIFAQISTDENDSAEAVAWRQEREDSWTLQYKINY